MNPDLIIYPLIIIHLFVISYNLSFSSCLNFWALQFPLYIFFLNLDKQKIIKIALIPESTCHDKNFGISVISSKKCFHFPGTPLFSETTLKMSTYYVMLLNLKIPAHFFRKAKIPFANAIIVYFFQNFISVWLGFF